jgi:3-oxoacyl-[acyl-carrier-protein] synthase I
MTPASLPHSGVVVIGTGACTHTGATALQVAMTWRADRSLPRESHLVDRSGEPIALCRADWIPDDVWGPQRLLRLGAPALAEAATRTAQVLGRPVPLLLALPAENEPRHRRIVGLQLIEELAARAGVPIDVGRSAAVARGRAGGALAAALAWQRLQAGADDAIVVGGLDSLFDPDLLEALDSSRRLHTPSSENGFVPGEGAAFVVLARRGRCQPLRPLAQVLGVATEDEPRPYGASDPCHGLGITQAAARVLAGLSRRVPWALTDVVNERHRVHEWTYVAARMHAAFVDGVRHDQPLLTTGELGAASACALMSMATVLWQTRGAPGDCVLVAVHSDGAERGALLLAEEPA